MRGVGVSIYKEFLNILTAGKAIIPKNNLFNGVYPQFLDSHRVVQTLTRRGVKDCSLSVISIKFKRRNQTESA